MASIRYYRTEAGRCRELADNSPDADMAQRWRGLASDYEKLADALEASSAVMPGQRMTVQAQPMQQQQSKTPTPEDKT